MFFHSSYNLQKSEIIEASVGEFFIAEKSVLVGVHLDKNIRQLVVLVNVCSFQDVKDIVDVHVLFPFDVVQLVYPLHLHVYMLSFKTETVHCSYRRSPPHKWAPTFVQGGFEKIGNRNLDNLDITSDMYTLGLYLFQGHGCRNPFDFDVHLLEVVNPLNIEVKEMKWMNQLNTFKPIINIEYPIGLFYN